jgi:hypothetical protein
MAEAATRFLQRHGPHREAIREAILRHARHRQAGVVPRSTRRRNRLAARRFRAMVRPPAETALGELRAHDLAGEGISALMLDGEYMAQRCAVVAPAITADSTNVTGRAAGRL